MTLLSHLLPIAIGWLASSLALIAEHIALARAPWRLQPPATYTVGVLTLLGGGLVWALLEHAPVEPLVALVAFAAIAMGSGTWVLLLYWWDERSARQQAVHRARELEDVARGLTAALRDERGQNHSQHHN